MTEDVLVRLYRSLIDALRRRHQDVNVPIKVAELYEELVPYRAVRSALGVELNADYEHALLRLLAGERDLVRLEPEEAREELRREVAAPYPFVGLFRKFSGSDVWVEQVPESELQAPAPRSEADPSEESPPDDSGETLPLRPSRRGPAAGASDAPVRLHRESGSAGHGGKEERSGGAVACVFCGGPLPSDRDVRFCPHCGGDQRLTNCPRCDSALEQDWRFCIGCGHEVRPR